MEDVKSKKSKRRLISNIIFMILLTILVVTLILSLGEINNIIAKFNEIANGNNWVWLLAAIGLALAYFILWPLSQVIFGKALKVEATGMESYLIGCSEHFYNGITPFAAGGQPFQIYSFTKRKVTTAKATGIVLTSFVTFMMVTNAFAIASLIFYKQIADGLETLNLGWLQYIAIVGFIINFAVLLFMIAMGTSKKLRNGFVNLFKKIAYAKMFHKEHKHKWSQKLFGKLGLALTNGIPKFEEYCNNAQIAFKETWTHKRATAFAIIIKIAAMACYYAIPFFILKAVGIELGFDKLILVLFCTSFAITSVVWMPTPGGTGGIEYAFMIVIAAVTGTSANDPAAVVLIWRMITFYFILIISFIANATFEAIASRKMAKEANEKPSTNDGNQEK